MQKISDLNVVKNLLIDMYDNGIEENGVVRKMDILDYYAICDIDIRKLNIVLREAGIPKNNHENSVINQLAIKYGGIVLSEEDFFKRIQNEKLSISGIEIPDEIKMEVMNYFKENKTFCWWTSTIRNGVTSVSYADDY